MTGKSPYESNEYRALLDVRKVVESLPLEHGKLKKAARRWLDGHSCSADLELSAVYVSDAIRWHRTSRESLKHAKTALLQMAVVYYARAFDERTRHRTIINIRSKLDQNSAYFHDLLIKLRHESLAHFGPAGPEIPWSADYALMVREGNCWQTLSAARRSLYEDDFARKFQFHLSEVCEIVNHELKIRRSKFENEISDAWNNEIEIHDILNACEIDVNLFGGWSGPLLGGERVGRTVVELPDTRRDI